MRLIKNKKLLYIGAFFVVIILFFLIFKLVRPTDSFYCNFSNTKVLRSVVSDFNFLAGPSQNKSTLKIYISNNESSNISIQNTITLWLRAGSNLKINDVNLASGDYLDPSSFYLLDINNEEIKSKYYILEDKSMVSAEDFSSKSNNLKVVAVRYYNVINDINPSKILDATYEIKNKNAFSADIANDLICAISVETSAGLKNKNVEWKNLFSYQFFSDFNIPYEQKKSDADSENNSESTTSCSEDPIIKMPDASSETIKKVAPGSTSAPVTSSSKKDILKSSESSLKNTDIFPDQFTVLYKDSNLKIGDKLELNVNFAPDNTTKRKISFSSSNPEIVSVEANTLTAHKAGSAIIHAESENNISLIFTISVDPNEDIILPFIKVKQENMSIIKGNAFSVEYECNQGNSLSEISSSNGDIISIDNFGVFHTVNVGEADITIKDKFGNSSVCHVIVTQAADSAY